MTLVLSIARRAAGAYAAAFAAVGLSAAASAAQVPGAAPSPAPARPAAQPAAKAAAAPTKGMQWVEAYEDCLARAKKERKLVLLDFYTDWCGWCKRLDRDVFAQDSFIQAADGVLAVKINAEKRPDLAARYQVNSYPRLFFLNADGVTVERIKGYLSLPDFTARVQAVKKGDTEFARLRDGAMDPTDLNGIYRFAKYLSDDRQHETGIQYWQQVHDLALQQIFQSPNAPGPMNFHREALIELARGYASVGLADVARQHFEEVLRVYSDNAFSAGDALVGLAHLAAKSPGGHVKAQQYLDRVVKEYPGTPAVSEALRLRQSLQATTVSAKSAP